MKIIRMTTAYFFMLKLIKKLPRWAVDYLGDYYSDAVYDENLSTEECENRLDKLLDEQGLVIYHKHSIRQINRFLRGKDAHVLALLSYKTGTFTKDQMECLGHNLFVEINRLINAHNDKVKITRADFNDFKKIYDFIVLDGYKGKSYFCFEHNDECLTRDLRDQLEEEK